MPRDGSGTYTLPVGNPVVTGTLIETTWANSTLSDIAVQLNNVITRDGVLGPISPFKLVDGAVATPGLAFNSEPGLGWFRPGANRISVAAVNAVVEESNYSSAAEIIKQVYPRTAGATSLRLDSNPFGTADTNYFQVRHAAAATTFDSVPVGTGVMAPFVFTSTVSKFQLTNTNVYGQFSRPALDAIELTLNKGVTAGSHIGIIGTRAGAPRWSINMADGTAEIGSNSGSDFNISRYNDAGAFLDKALTIRRNTGTYIFNMRYGGSFIVADEDLLYESFRTDVNSEGGVSNFTRIQGNFEYRASGFTGAVAGAKADFYGDLNFPNTGSPGGINLAPVRGIGFNAWVPSGSYRQMILWNSAEGGNGSGLSCRGTMYLNPGVQAIFRVDVDAGQFNMDGGGTGTSAGGWIATSDARVKTNRKIIENALWKISQLTGETYDKTDMRGLGGVVPRKAGYIAQMVQAVLPEAVTAADDEIGTLSVDHNGLIGLLIEGVKELHARLDQLEA